MSDNDQLGKEATSGGNDSKDAPATMPKGEKPMNESKNLRKLSEAEVLANELEEMAQELREGDDLQIGLSETGRRKNHAPVKVTEDVSVWKLAERVVVEAHIQYSVRHDTDDDFRAIENPGGSGEEQTLIEALDDAGISLDDSDDSDYDLLTE